MNPDLIKQWVLTALRYAVILGLGKVLTKYNLTSDDVATLISGIATFAMLVWAFWNKLRYEGKVNTALDLPKGTSKDTLIDVLKSGNGTSPTATK